MVWASKGEQGTCSVNTRSLGPAETVDTARTLVCPGTPGHVLCRCLWTVLFWEQVLCLNSLRPEGGKVKTSS